MSSQRIELVQKLFHAALEIPVVQRDAWLHRQCHGDEELYADVLSLLAEDGRLDNALEAGSPDRLSNASPEPPSHRAEHGLRVRCPHCRNPIELVDDFAFEELSCPSCGSTFSLIKEIDTVSYRPETEETLGHFLLQERLGIGAFGLKEINGLVELHE